MRDLILHPHCRPGRITRAAADIRPTAEGCTARFRFEGDIAAIKIPETEEPTRTDELWKSTCFEIFWQPENGTNYREFNLSPSTRWACYEFDDYRSNMRDAPAEVAIECSRDEASLDLTCNISSELPVPAAIGLSAIGEVEDGALQYWALDFAPGKPDFHSGVCRNIHLGDRL